MILISKSLCCLSFLKLYLMKWVNPIDYTDRNLKKILITV